MLPTLQLEKFGLSTTFTFIARIVVCTRICCSIWVSLLRWLRTSGSGLRRLFLRHWSRNRGKLLCPFSLSLIYLTIFTFIFLFCKHLSKYTRLLKVLRELSRLSSLTLGHILLLFGRRIIQSVSWLFLNRFDAEIFNKALHTLKPFMKLVALR